VMFHTVIVNILENSVKYKDTEQAKLLIECLSPDNAVEIRLTDNGPGVPKEALEKLFDVFYRADPSRNTQASGPGSGLGLAISQKLINYMGGSISAEASHPRGLSIVIRLPRRKSPQD